MNIRPVGAELLHADGQTDIHIDRWTHRHGEGNSRVSQFCESSKNKAKHFCDFLGDKKCPLLFFEVTFLLPSFVSEFRIVDKIVYFVFSCGCLPLGLRTSRCSPSMHEEQQSVPQERFLSSSMFLRRDTNAAVNRIRLARATRYLSHCPTTHFYQLFANHV
jgi:hypothetical protein